MTFGEFTQKLSQVEPRGLSIEIALLAAGLGRVSLVWPRSAQGFDLVRGQCTISRLAWIGAVLWIVVQSPQREVRVESLPVGTFPESAARL